MIIALVRFIQSWKRYNKALRELEVLGDRDLAKRGISRFNLPQAAWEAANR